MKTEHTPGPWKVVNSKALGIDMELSDHVFQVSDGQRWIANINKGLHSDEANARLIAAAPELFNACIKAAEQICNHESGHTLQFQRVQDLLDNVIAKATGSTHNTVNK
jgi:glutathionylspermidine synthase